MADWEDLAGVRMEAWDRFAAATISAIWSNPNMLATLNLKIDEKGAGPDAIFPTIAALAEGQADAMLKLHDILQGVIAHV